jgi:hypothetical protein
MLEHWPQGLLLQIGFPNSMVSFFSALGANIQGHNSSAFINSLGQIEIFFFYLSLDS